MKKMLMLAAALLLRAGSVHAKKVVIISWNDSEPRYTVARDEMKKAAAGSEVVVLDAGGKKEKLAELIKTLKNENSGDIYAPLGTSAAVPVAKEITDKPVVFAVVYDPIVSGIAKDWQSSGNNTTGSSTFVSIPNFLRRIVKRSGLVVKKIGVLYTPGEKNSELQMEAVRSVEKDLGVEVALVPVAKPEDITAFGKDLKGKYDFIMLTGSNVVGSNIAAIIEAANKAKVMTGTHLDDLVTRGCLIGLVADPMEVAKLSGKALAAVLNGAAPSTVPIEYPLPKLVINEKTLAAGGFALPQDIQDWAKSSKK